MKKISISLIVLLTSLTPIIAQGSEVEDLLKSNNKMTAVNVVLLIILFSVLIFLVFQERRIKKIEDRLK